MRRSLPSQTTGAETEGVPQADLPHPDLRVRNAGEQSIRGGNFIPVHLPVFRLDVDEDELPLILWPHVREHDAVIDLVSAPGDFFDVIARLR
jgi:hypothetical protein